MICAVIFDMDGVLIDTEKHYNAAWCQAATEAGFPLPESMRFCLEAAKPKRARS